MYHEARLCSRVGHTGACKHLLMCVLDTRVECPLKTHPQMLAMSHGCHNALPASLELISGPNRSGSSSLTVGLGATSIYSTSASVSPSKNKNKIDIQPLPQVMFFSVFKHQLC